MTPYIRLGDIKGDVDDVDTSAQPYLQIELKDVLVSNWHTSTVDTSGGEWIELNSFSFDGTTGAGQPRSAGDDSPTESISFSFAQPKVDYFGGTADSGGGGGTGKVSVHDISITKQCDDASNVELTVNVLDGRSMSYGAMTDVGYTLTVTDTQTGYIPGRESNLTYSGESGGINEVGIRGPSGHYTQLVWADSRVGNTGTHEVGHWMGLYHTYETSVRPVDPFFAYDEGFTGGVSVAASDVYDAGYDDLGRLVAVTDAGVSVEDFARFDLV